MEPGSLSVVTLIIKFSHLAFGVQKNTPCRFSWWFFPIGFVFYLSQDTSICYLIGFNCLKFVFIRAWCRPVASCSCVKIKNFTGLTNRGPLLRPLRFHCHAIKNTNRSKSKNQEYGKWKKVNTKRSSPKISSAQFFICEISGEMFYLNLSRFLWRRHVGTL